MSRHGRRIGQMRPFSRAEWCKVVLAIWSSERVRLTQTFKRSVLLVWVCVWTPSHGLVKAGSWSTRRRRTKKLTRLARINNVVTPKLRRVMQDGELLHTSAKLLGPVDVDTQLLTFCALHCSALSQHGWYTESSWGSLAFLTSAMLTALAVTLWRPCLYQPWERTREFLCTHEQSSTHK